jgi:hypothetical protein
MPPMKDRRRSATPRQNATRRVSLLPALVLLAGCSSLAEPREEAPTAPLDPGYRAMIATHLKTIFRNLTPGDGVEISDPRWVQANKGWSWQVCVQFQDRGHRRSYALFFRGSEFIDERYAVLTDACAAQSYSALDLGAGAIRPGSVGDPGPLY